jgi:hypothetical protein
MKSTFYIFAYRVNVLMNYVIKNLITELFAFEKRTQYG